MLVRHNTELLEKAVDLAVKRAAIPTLQAEAAAQRTMTRATGLRRLATGGAIALAAVGIGLGVMLGFWQPEETVASSKDEMAKTAELAAPPESRQEAIYPRPSEETPPIQPLPTDPRESAPNQVEGARIAATSATASRSSATTHAQTNTVQGCGGDPPVYATTGVSREWAYQASIAVPSSGCVNDARTTEQASISARSPSTSARSRPCQLPRKSRRIGSTGTSPAAVRSSAARRRYSSAYGGPAR